MLTPLPAFAVVGRSSAPPSRLPSTVFDPPPSIRIPSPGKPWTHSPRIVLEARRITIDLDPTDDPTHGGQQLALFKGFYDRWCYERVGGNRVDEARFLLKTCGAPTSFHDVIEVEPARRVRLRDVLLSTEQDVFEKSGSEMLRVGDVVFARVVPCDGVALMIGSGSIALPPIEKQPILQLRESLRKTFGPPTPELLFAREREIRNLYLILRDRLMNPAPPVLNNTDGDPLEFHTITCQVESADAAFGAMKSLARGEPDEDLLHDATFDKDGRLKKVEFTWTKAGNKLHKSWDNTVLGHVTIEGPQLTVEVNSAKRAQKIQAEIRKRLAGARKLTVTIKPLDEALEDHERTRDTPAERKRRADEAKLRARPEVQEMMKQVLVAEPESDAVVEIGIPDPDAFVGDAVRLAGWDTPIARHFLEPGARAGYEYDFGDGWEHELVLESILDPIRGTKYPRCVAGARACPPEDCGGIPGYQRVLKIVASPGHKEHASLLEWLGGSFDPEAFDPARVKFSDPKKRWKAAFGRG